MHDKMYDSNGEYKTTSDEIRKRNIERVKKAKERFSETKKILGKYKLKTGYEEQYSNAIDEFEKYDSQHPGGGPVSTGLAVKVLSIGQKYLDESLRIVKAR